MSYVSKARDAYASKNFQFNTRIMLEGNKLEQVRVKKLLCLIIRDDLNWKSNTDELTRRAYSRMLILKNLVKFDVPLPDLVQIYNLYVRSVVEQSAVVWHPSITKGEQRDLERTQKVAMKIILGQNYVSYEQSLKLTGLETLIARREKLSLSFAKKCTKKQGNTVDVPSKYPYHSNQESRKV